MGTIARLYECHDGQWLLFYITVTRYMLLFFAGTAATTQRVDNCDGTVAGERYTYSNVQCTMFIGISSGTPLL